MRCDFTERPALIGRALAFAIAIACAVPTTPHWSDDGVHVVDGTWIVAEHPCATTAGDCLAAVRAAEGSMDIAPDRVVRAATAGIPNHWTRADGQTIIVLATTQRDFVVLDLADGSRRVIIYGCGGVSVDGTQPCGAYADDTYQVGHSPPVEP
jgi:hypothetical protein